MAVHHITADLVRSLLDYDAESGLLGDRRISRGRAGVGKIARNHKERRISLGVCQRRFRCCTSLDLVARSWRMADP
jgi:hypothetical protein